MGEVSDRSLWRSHALPVLLDEIGDLSAAGQAMLVRFLQEREVRPLGTTRAVRLDVRVIAATNRDLEAAVARKEFRADLYDRLAEVIVRVPALREQREDIAALAEHFIALNARRHGVAVRGLTSQARHALVAHDWPGNVRALEKAISRGVIFAEGGWIDADDLELTPAAVAGVVPSADEREADALSDPRDTGDPRGAIPGDSVAHVRSRGTLSWRDSRRMRSLVTPVMSVITVESCRFIWTSAFCVRWTCVAALCTKLRPSRTVMPQK
ncbi:MAG: hypothetical protein DMD91_22385 [Candidatus Rokuibacteriota bacterium]|nr:MAG: hypothetical protein DMD91_22385 [Candidatus Rokubacteria bacterium]